MCESSERRQHHLGELHIQQSHNLTPRFSEFRPAQVTLHRHLITWCTSVWIHAHKHTLQHVCLCAYESQCVSSPYLFDAGPYLSMHRRVCIFMSPNMCVCECVSHWSHWSGCVCFYISVCVWSVNWAELWPDGLYRSGYLFIEQHLSNLSIMQTCELMLFSDCETTKLSSRWSCLSCLWH